MYINEYPTIHSVMTDDEPEGPSINYSGPRKFDDRRARSHADAAGNYSDQEAAEQGLAFREEMSWGDET